MKFMAVFGLLALLALLSAEAWARPGKVFFKNGKGIRGDIQIQTNNSGRKIVVIALKSGSMIFSKKDVAKIVYSKKSSSPHANFHKALKNTRPLARKALKVPARYESIIEEASKKNKLDPLLVKAVIKQESNFNSRNVSPAGAQGLMQLMPDTARELGVKNSFDPTQNVQGGAKYLKQMLDLFDGSLPQALAAYNAGPNAVRKYGQVPSYKETRNYVRQVLKDYDSLRVGRLIAFQDEKGNLTLTDRPYAGKKKP